MNSPADKILLNHQSAQQFFNDDRQLRLDHKPTDLNLHEMDISDTEDQSSVIATAREPAMASGFSAEGWQSAPVLNLNNLEIGDGFFNLDKLSVSVISDDGENDLARVLNLTEEDALVDTDFFYFESDKSGDDDEIDTKVVTANGSTDKNIVGKNRSDDISSIDIFSNDSSVSALNTVQKNSSENLEPKLTSSSIDIYSNDTSGLNTILKNSFERSMDIKSYDTSESGLNTVKKNSFEHLPPKLSTSSVDIFSYDTSKLNIILKNSSELLEQKLTTSSPNTTCTNLTRGNDNTVKLDTTPCCEFASNSIADITAETTLAHILPNTTLHADYYGPRHGPEQDTSQNIKTKTAISITDNYSEEIRQNATLNMFSKSASASYTTLINTQSKSDNASNEFMYDTKIPSILNIYQKQNIIDNTKSTKSIVSSSSNKLIFDTLDEHRKTNIYEFSDSDSFLSDTLSIESPRNIQNMSLNNEVSVSKTDSYQVFGASTSTKATRIPANKNASYGPKVNLYLNTTDETLIHKQLATVSASTSNYKNTNPIDSMTISSSNKKISELEVKQEKTSLATDFNHTDNESSSTTIVANNTHQHDTISEIIKHTLSNSICNNQLQDSDVTLPSSRLDIPKTVSTTPKQKGTLVFSNTELSVLEYDVLQDKKRVSISFDSANIKESSCEKKNKTEHVQCKLTSYTSHCTKSCCLDKQSIESCQVFTSKNKKQGINLSNDTDCCDTLNSTVLSCGNTGNTDVSEFSIAKSSTDLMYDNNITLDHDAVLNSDSALQKLQLLTSLSNSMKMSLSKTDKETNKKKVKYEEISSDTCCIKTNRTDKPKPNNDVEIAEVFNIQEVSSYRSPGYSHESNSRTKLYGTFSSSESSSWLATELKPNMSLNVVCVNNQVLTKPTSDQQLEDLTLIDSLKKLSSVEMSIHKNSCSNHELSGLDTSVIYSNDNIFSTTVHTSTCNSSHNEFEAIDLKLKAKYAKPVDNESLSSLYSKSTLIVDTEKVPEKVKLQETKCKKCRVYERYLAVLLKSSLASVSLSCKLLHCNSKSERQKIGTNIEKCVQISKQLSEFIGNLNLSNSTNLETVKLFDKLNSNSKQKVNAISSDNKLLKLKSIRQPRGDSELFIYDTKPTRKENQANKKMKRLKTLKKKICLTHNTKTNKFVSFLYERHATDRNRRIDKSVNKILEKLEKYS